MKKNILVSSRSSSRGASLVEYALLLVAVLILGAAGMKALGPKIGQAGINSSAAL